MNLKDLLHEIKKLHPEADLARVERAFEFMQKAHEGQKRLSGDPYYMHPLQIAIRLAQMDMDLPTIIAGLLHDVPENTAVTLEEIEREFG